MNLAVCFKTLPDYRMVAEKDWLVDRDLTVDLDWVRRIHNCYEESALELALQLAGDGEDGPSLQTTALTIDSESADLFLSHLYAVGYNRGVRIDCGSAIDVRFNPKAVSLLIAAYVKQVGGQDLILLGAQGGLGDHRQTGYLVAERLGWPCIGDVVDVIRDPEPGWLKVTSSRNGGIVTQTVRLPVVLVIGNVLRSPYLRVPTLQDKLATKGRRALVLSPDDLSVSPAELGASSQRLCGLERFPKKSACTMLTGASAAEKARVLYERYLAERLVR